MKVLIVEDNQTLANRIKNQLKRWYSTEIAPSGDAALRLIYDHSFDIVLLDLGLPDMDGSAICQQIRTYSKDIPILIVTGVDSTESRLTLFELGADDYVTKPFEPAELYARISALLRRRQRGECQSVIEVGDVTIDPNRRTVIRQGQPIFLRRKEFDILECLAINQGRVMSRENIIDHAWKSTSTTWPGSVDVHIKQLRDKIDKPFAYPLIKTSYGTGYIFEANNTLQSSQVNSVIRSQENEK